MPCVFDSISSFFVLLVLVLLVLLSCYLSFSFSFAGFIINLLWVDGLCTIGLRDWVYGCAGMSEDSCIGGMAGGEDEKGLIVMFTIV